MGEPVALKANPEWVEGIWLRRVLSCWLLGFARSVARHPPVMGAQAGLLARAIVMPSKTCPLGSLAPSSWQEVGRAGGLGCFFSVYRGGRCTQKAWSGMEIVKNPYAVPAMGSTLELSPTVQPPGQGRQPCGGQLAAMKQLGRRLGTAEMTVSPLSVAFPPSPGCSLLLLCLGGCVSCGPWGGERSRRMHSTRSCP